MEDWRDTNKAFNDWRKVAKAFVVERNVQPTHQRITGDGDAAKALLSRAQKWLGDVSGRLALGGIGAGSFTTQLPDGSWVRVVQNDFVKAIEIFSPLGGELPGRATVVIFYACPKLTANPYFSRPDFRYGWKKVDDAIIEDIAKEIPGRPRSISNPVVSTNLPYDSFLQISARREKTNQPYRAESAEFPFYVTNTPVSNTPVDNGWAYIGDQMVYPYTLNLETNLYEPDFSEVYSWTSPYIGDGPARHILTVDDYSGLDLAQLMPVMRAVFVSSTVSQLALYTTTRRETLGNNIEFVRITTDSMNHAVFYNGDFGFRINAMSQYEHIAGLWVAKPAIISPIEIAIVATVSHKIIQRVVSNVTEYLRAEHTYSFYLGQKNSPADSWTFSLVKTETTLGILAQRSDRTIYGNEMMYKSPFRFSENGAQVSTIINEYFGNGTLNGLPGQADYSRHAIRTWDIAITLSSTGTPVKVQIGNPTDSGYVTIMEKGSTTTQANYGQTSGSESRIINKTIYAHEVNGTTIGDKTNKYPIALNYIQNELVVLYADFDITSDETTELTHTRNETLDTRHATYNGGSNGNIYLEYSDAQKQGYQERICLASVHDYLTPTNPLYIVAYDCANGVAEANMTLNNTTGAQTFSLTTSITKPSELSSSKLIFHIDIKNRIIAAKEIMAYSNIRYEKNSNSEPKWAPHTVFQEMNYKHVVYLYRGQTEAIIHNKITTVSFETVFSPINPSKQSRIIPPSFYLLTYPPSSETITAGYERSFNDSNFLPYPNQYWVNDLDNGLIGFKPSYKKLWNQHHMYAYDSMIAFNHANLNFYIGTSEALPIYLTIEGTNTSDLLNTSQRIDFPDNTVTLSNVVGVRGLLGTLFNIPGNEQQSLSLIPVSFPPVAP